MPKPMSKPSVTAAALKLSEAARYLNISESSVHRLLRRGEIKGNRKLGRWLFSIENLEAWLKTE
jgi:excisionase family DNA binding protein